MHENGLGLPDLMPAKGRRKASLCVGCGGQINDKFILRVAPNLEWHGSCLKCAECSLNLDENCTCFVRDGKTYCKQDYFRLFGFKCAKCGQLFKKTDLVMRAKTNIYHLSCFRCDVCNRKLETGDEFALRDDGLYCKADHEVSDRSTNNNNSPCDDEIIDDTKDTDDSVNQDSKSGGTSPEHPNSGSSHSNQNGHPTRKEKGHKTTRVRTVLNEKQLHTLRTCYGANPRPDALMKEQLVEMTGLSPRVIRVWFQNKRCKDKKRSILMKQMQHQQQEKACVFQQGIPMVATSPVRHEPPVSLQNQPIEVQTYQAPWKALAEFAMSDMDPNAQAPFQQLVSAFGDFPSSDDDSVVTMEESPTDPGMMSGHRGHHRMLYPSHHHHHHHHHHMSYPTQDHLVIADL